MWTRAPAPSVTLTASASPLRGLTLATSAAGSQVTGGTTSAVTTNLPEVSRSLKRLRRAACGRVSGPGIGWSTPPCGSTALKQAVASVVNARPAIAAATCRHASRQTQWDRAIFAAGTIRFGPTTEGSAMPLLQDKVCVITGGAGSLGLASARLFLAEGAKVMLVDLGSADLDSAKRGL